MNQIKTELDRAIEASERAEADEAHRQQVKAELLKIPSFARGDNAEPKVTIISGGEPMSVEQYVESHTSIEPVVENNGSGNNNAAGNLSDEEGETEGRKKESKQGVQIRIRVTPEGAISLEQENAIVRRFRKEYIGKTPLRPIQLLVQGRDDGMVRIHVSLRGLTKMNHFIKVPEGSWPYYRDADSALNHVLQRMGRRQAARHEGKQDLAEQQRTAGRRRDAVFTPEP